MNKDLTNREYEVLKLVAENKSNTQIANMLSISIHTVKAHICSIIEKLNANGRTHAAVKAPFCSSKILLQFFMVFSNFSSFVSNS